MKRVYAVAIAVFIAICPALAKETKKTVGGWTIVKSEDAFSDSEKVMLMKSAERIIIMVRCFSGVPNLAMVTPERFEAGGSFSLKLRLDRGPIVEAGATALSSQVLETNDIEDYFYRDMRTAKVLAIRVSGESVSTDYKISLGGIDQAFSEFAEPCKIPQQ
ncbi:hypothetical protein EYW49_08970 [Siculibacillus lacustris]|uniref:Invasion associated locus B family protein n=1 Tax=Siculibacillus lacustris TaxID=1549641 RepID=A0A4V2KTV1_9HYPH|nr:hypothetical protein [Siculibacillus lacustris]TBW38810.1 hypothetical protein EYW49_08970 [Siculibacillus lacustris]